MSLEKKILTYYSNQTYNSKNVFKYNELSQNILVNYLSRVNKSDGSIFNNDDLSRIFANSLNQNPTGTCFRQLNNWKLITPIYKYDMESNTIILPVVLSTNRILEIMKQDKDNKYILDASVMRYIHNRNANIAILAVDRLFTNYKQMPTKMLNYIPITNTYADIEIRQMLVERLSVLDNYIKKKLTPPKCTKIKWQKKEGKNVNMTCTYYCDFTAACPHYSKRAATSAKINRLIF